MTGGELLSLRYDLTVPFARYLAQNKINAIKRYQIGKVYRRDQPAMSRGRFREFYQCVCIQNVVTCDLMVTAALSQDFDIAGKSDEMMADSEILKLTFEILKDLDLVSNLTIKINHREILDGLFTICGVPKKLFRTICSSVDKLDKTEWTEIRKEMIEEKGLKEDVADRIGSFVTMASGRIDLIDKLSSDDQLGKSKDAKRGLDQLRQLFNYTSLLGISDYILFDMSLARGLDYYTGVIYEAVINGADGVGSIAAGGRYDNLVGSLLAADGKTGFQVPCVGVSIGIERIFSILEARRESTDSKLYPTKILVASAGKNMVDERIKLLTELWELDVPSEQLNKKNPKMLDQLQYCEDKGIPLAIIVGEDEVKRGIVKIRTVASRTEIEVQRDNYLDEVKKMISQLD